MIEINKDSLEARILKILMVRYPITAKELGTELGVKGSVLKPILLELRRMRILDFDFLPDKTFIRLLRNDFSFVGIKAEQRKGIVKKSSKQTVKDYEGIAYR
ncbi:MAG: transcriptional regulator [Candidatus Altiarchaeota archaeon]|nr:transcriptional regulator [Candidatus Altiarchaeota archaeon]MBU4407020.1 transcriptional regulator [Candidatus Altiarchaeota archaeon]